MTDKIAQWSITVGLFLAGGPGSASLIFVVPNARFVSVGLLLSRPHFTYHAPARRSLGARGASQVDGKSSLGDKDGHSPLLLRTCPEDSFGTGFRPVLFSAPRPVSFSSHLLLPFPDEHSLHPDFLPKLLPAFRCQSSLPVHTFPPQVSRSQLSTLDCFLIGTQNRVKKC